MKDTLTKTDLVSHLESLKRNILDLGICTYNISAIIKASQNGTNTKAINNYLSHYVYLTYAYSAIVIYKILSPSEKRSFQKLFRKLENCRYDSELSELLRLNIEKQEAYLYTSKNQILEDIKKLEGKITEKNDVLKKIHDRRNTFYAHNEPNKTYPVENLQDLKEVHILSKEIFKKLYGNFFDSNYLFVKHYWSIDSVLEQSKFIDDHFKDLEDSLDNN